MNTRNWKRLLEMDPDQIEAFAQAHGVDMTREFDDVADARRYVADALLIERPADDTGHTNFDDADPNDDIEIAIGDNDDDAGSELDRRARALQRKRPDLSYGQCLGRMREKFPGLTRRYAKSFPSGISKRSK